MVILVLTVCSLNCTLGTLEHRRWNKYWPEEGKMIPNTESEGCLGGMSIGRCYDIIPMSLQPDLEITSYHAYQVLLGAPRFPPTQTISSHPQM